MRIASCNPANANLGALVVDYDWRSEHSALHILEAIARYKVLVFRGVIASDSDLIGLLDALGPSMFTSGEIPVEGAPQLNLVSNIGRKTPPRSVFHTDTSYVPCPPALSALRAVAIPAEGGATLFTDQVLAADTLPPECREWLVGRKLRHKATGPDGVRLAATHPLLRRHPTTGETALYMSTPERCGPIDGLTAEQSQRLVGLLYRHSIRDTRLYRHKWRAHDIVLFDNRTTLHKADHAGVKGDRVLHRGMVRGEAPVAATD